MSGPFGATSRACVIRVVARALVLAAASQAIDADPHAVRAQRTQWCTQWSVTRVERVVSCPPPPLHIFLRALSLAPLGCLCAQLKRADPSARGGAVRLPRGPGLPAPLGSRSHGQGRVRGDPRPQGGPGPARQDGELFIKERGEASFPREPATPGPPQSIGGNHWGNE